MTLRDQVDVALARDAAQPGQIVGWHMPLRRHPLHFILRGNAGRASLSIASATATAASAPLLTVDCEGQRMLRSAARATPQASESTWCACGVARSACPCSSRVVRTVAVTPWGAAFFRCLSRDSHAFSLASPPPRVRTRRPRSRRPRQARRRRPATRRPMRRSRNVTCRLALMAATIFCAGPRFLHSTRLDMSSHSPAGEIDSRRGHPPPSLRSRLPPAPACSTYRSRSDPYPHGCIDRMRATGGARKTALAATTRAFPPWPPPPCSRLGERAPEARPCARLIPLTVAYTAH